MNYSIIIVNYNGKHLLDTCISSLLPQVKNHSDIILVDNGSQDNSIDYIKEKWPTITLHALDENSGFTGGNNVGASLSNSEIIVLLNNDTRVASDWLENLLKPFEDKTVGAVSSSMRKMDSIAVMDSAGAAIDSLGYGFDRGRGDSAVDWQQVEEIIAPCGGAMALRRSALENRNTIFWDKLFLYNEDIDLGLRLWKNKYRVVYQPTAIVEHALSATSGLVSPVRVRFCARNRLLILKKHLGRDYNKIVLLLRIWEILAFSFMLIHGQFDRLKPSIAGSREGFKAKEKPYKITNSNSGLFSRFMIPTKGSYIRRKIGDKVLKIIVSENL